MTLPPDIPPEVVGFLQTMGYLDSERLQLGDPVPVLALPTVDGTRQVAIGSPDATRPTVLVFGSYT